MSAAIYHMGLLFLEIKAVEIHHFYPRGYKVIGELLVCIICSIHFGNSSQF
jgi:hypothetical protein